MHTSNTLTIRELPKTKKMAVDEMHPVLRMQKNVSNHQCSASHSTRRRNLTRLPWSMVAPCPWWFAINGKSSPNPRECPDFAPPSSVHPAPLSSWEQSEQIEQDLIRRRVQPRRNREGSQRTRAVHEAIQLIDGSEINRNQCLYNYRLFTPFSRSNWYRSLKAIRCLSPPKMYIFPL